jgi:hypothetical protein
MIAVSPHRTSERGFALLIIFLFAAAVALMLYVEVPRVAFETERDKEQLLIDRGEQYKRGIQLYLQANRRFPSSLDDLEQRDKRFLRRRYVDPYTGKSDTWRLIHSNGQYLTDSLVTLPPDAKIAQTNAAAALASNSTDGQPTVNSAVLQRPSDRLTLPGGITGLTDPNNPAAYPGSQIGDAQPLPPMNIQQLQQQQQQQAGGIPNGLPGAPGQPLRGQVSGQPTVAGLPILQPGVSPGFRVDANGQIVAVPPGTPTGTPGVGQPQNQAGGVGGTANPAAANLINTLLTTGRQQQPQPASNPALLQNNNNTVGGGIAGVASSHQGPSIKVYLDQQTYQTWEFVAQGTGGVAGPGGATPGAPRPPGAPAAPGPSPAGATGIAR